MVLGMGVVTMSCKNDVDYYSLPTYSHDQQLQAVIEIPAGTNIKIEYNKNAKAFQIDQKNGQDRVIEFLPYQGNYGFIPSTYSDPNAGGDGDALDILVISESMPTGTVPEVIPLGVLKLIDDDEQDYKIIANIYDPEKQIIKATNFEEFEGQYPNIMKMIELWFLNYNPDDPSKIEGWGTEVEASLAIKNNLLK